MGRNIAATNGLSNKNQKNITIPPEKQQKNRGKSIFQRSFRGESNKRHTEQSPRSLHTSSFRVPSPLPPDPGSSPRIIRNHSRKQICLPVQHIPSENRPPTALNVLSFIISPQFVNHPPESFTDYSLTKAISSSLLHNSAVFDPVQKELSENDSF